MLSCVVVDVRIILLICSALENGFKFLFRIVGNSCQAWSVSVVNWNDFFGLKVSICIYLDTYEIAYYHIFAFGVNFQDPQSLMVVYIHTLWVRIPWEFSSWSCALEKPAIYMGVSRYVMKVFIYLLVCLSVCLSVCMYVCLYVCIYVWMYVCIHACMHVCMYVCMYECM